MSLFTKVSSWIAGHKVISSSIGIALAFIVGASAQYVTGKKDGHIEQLAESVLMKNGIEIDFSPEIASD